MFESFLSILYPRNCIHCQQCLVKGECNLCTECLEKLPVNEGIGDFTELKHEVYSSFLFRNQFYYLKYYKNGITQSILHQIKYTGNVKLAMDIGLWYGNLLVKEGFQNQFDILIPVPLNWKKLKIRGYNQSECIGRGLIKVLHCDMDPELLVRKINNPTQTHKTRAERIQNVRNIFQVNRNIRDVSKRILLVDDVITTGATLESCAEVLIKAGFKDISFAAIAYAKK